MDREQLYKNLTELERQLQKVKSANEQVEKIIESDRLLVSGIQEYISKADALLGAFRSAYDTAVAKVNEQVSLVVKETTDGLLSEYESQVRTVHSEYNASMKESVDSFKSVVDSEKKALKTKVADLTALVDGKLIPLRESLSSIVDGKIARIPDDFNGIINESKSTFDSAAAALKSASDVVTEECRKMAEKVVVLPDKFDGLGSDLTKAISDNKKKMLAKLAEIDVDAFAGKVTVALSEQTVHLDGKLGKLEKSFDGSLSKVDRSLTGGVKKIDTHIGEVDKKLSAMQEKLDGMSRTLNFFKVLAIVLVIVGTILVFKFII